MHFQPRIRSAGETNPGVVCCSAELALCDTCKAHFAWDVSWQRQRCDC